MTEFGRTVWLYCGERGLTSRQAIADALARNGYGISRQSVSNYLRGECEAPHEFVGALARVLRLGDEQRLELAMAYAYGQHKDGESGYRAPVPRPGQRSSAG